MTALCTSPTTAPTVARASPGVHGLGRPLGGWGGREGRRWRWPGLGWRGGRELSEDGAGEPLPGRREASLSRLPGSRGWSLAKGGGSFGCRSASSGRRPRPPRARGGISCLTWTLNPWCTLQKYGLWQDLVEEVLSGHMPPWDRNIVAELLLGSKPVHFQDNLVDFLNH